MKKLHSLSFTFMDVTAFKIFSTFATYIYARYPVNALPKRQFVVTRHDRAYFEAKANFEQLKGQLAP
jgi:hypothetical protein